VVVVRDRKEISVTLVAASRPERSIGRLLPGRPAGGRLQVRA